jgi:hypothetical protein
MSRSIRAGVDSFVGGLQSAAHLWSPPRAPLDPHDGAHPVPPLLKRSLEEIRDVVNESTLFSFSDLVSVTYHVSSCRTKLTFVSSISLHTLTLLLILVVSSMIESIWYAPRRALQPSDVAHLLFHSLRKS